MTEFIKVKEDLIIRSTESILTDVRYIASKEVTRIKTYIGQGKPLSDRDSCHLKMIVQTLVLADTELRSAERHSVSKLQDLSPEQMAELVKAHVGLLDAPKTS